MATDDPSSSSVSTIRRSKIQGAVAMNTLVRSLFMSSAEVGTMTRVRSGPIRVTVANMFGFSA
jgi:hypothetical protein